MPAALIDRPKRWYSHSAISEIASYDNIRRQYVATPVQWVDTDVGEIRTPPMAESAKNAPLLVDGRKGWLLRRSARWARYNAGVIAPIAGDGRAVNDNGEADVLWVPGQNR